MRILKKPHWSFCEKLFLWNSPLVFRARHGASGEILRLRFNWGRFFGSKSGEKWQYKRVKAPSALRTWAPRGPSVVESPRLSGALGCRAPFPYRNVHFWINLSTILSCWEIPPTAWPPFTPSSAPNRATSNLYPSSRSTSSQSRASHRDGQRISSAWS